mmetsp:Transcript_10171/g.42642  ORF Transcript_10171/g.42642 Transcript_10171/m.42642 type:complete len:92 (-) Transcript_10171:19-294(-)
MSKGAAQLDGGLETLAHFLLVSVSATTARLSLARTTYPLARGGMVLKTPSRIEHIHDKRINIDLLAVEKVCLSSQLLLRKIATLGRASFAQ